jgi:succinate dehydrogenase/fumarate reductase flavoprotein subunit
VDLDPNPVVADVLVVGGGIGGLMAAIRAAELGADVAVIEKGNARRSGSGGMGNDHFACYIPEVHGSVDAVVQEHMLSLLGGLQDLSMVRAYYLKSFEIVQLWEKWGIPMRPHGYWEFTGHALPGHLRFFLKFAGANQKLVLEKQARYHHVRIFNRTPAVELIKEDGRVVGAVGIDSSRDEPVIRIFLAKSVVLTTGSVNRIYPPTTPAWLFNSPFMPANTGDGRAMALRAGANLVNMEFPYTHAGPRYLERSGKATWVGYFKDLRGNRVSAFLDRPSKELGEPTSDIFQGLFDHYRDTGRGPVYMDTTEDTDDDIEYMEWGHRNEGNVYLLKALRDEGVDFRRHMVEFGRYNPAFTSGRGIEVNEAGETNVEGLYSAGDEMGNLRATLGGAAVFGWIAGESAARRALSTEAPRLEDPAGHPAVRRVHSLARSFMDRNSGASWREANIALEQIMWDYAGIRVRSESLLTAGLTYLRRLRRKAIDGVAAANSHELVRTFEVLNLMDVGEAAIEAALERKETRFTHVRVDYPYANPLYTDMFLRVRRIGGELGSEGEYEFEWRRRHRHGGAKRDRAI